MPDRFAGGGETDVHPIVVIAMVLVGALILFRQRKGVIVPFLAAAFLIPTDQVLVLGPLHFPMLRLLMAIGWVSMLFRISPGNRIFSGGFNRLDKTVVLWASCTVIATVALWQSVPALNNQMGFLYTVLGLYFFMRSFIRDEEDVLIAIRGLAYISAVIAVVMLVEQFTRSNPYLMLGGTRAWVRENPILREGGLRAMGPFQHPIRAGTFGAISLPLYVALWYRETASRTTAVVGMLAATTITFATGSSTPVIAYGAAIFALCMWSMRQQMRLVRWVVAIALVGLHLVMKAPVWALIARVDLTGNSSSYHRYMLLNECIRHFSNWWLLGVKDTASWGWDMWDLANQYVAVAATSGMVPLILFLAILVLGFKYLGTARRQAGVEPRQERFIWALGAALFTNCVAFFGISYDDQTVVSWYLMLAITAVFAQSIKKASETSRQTCAQPQKITRPYPTTIPFSEKQDIHGKVSWPKIPAHHSRAR
jgi:hypothetical protein